MATSLKNLVHYVCWKANDPTKLGATKLNKILWFIDSWSYRANGCSISGAKYEKRQYGPVPKCVLDAIEELQEEKKIIVRNTDYYWRVKRDYIALSEPHTAELSENDRSRIDDITSHICNNHTAVSISEVSHDLIWDAAKPGEEIPLYAVLAATPGEITEDDMNWADHVIEGRSP